MHDRFSAVFGSMVATMAVALAAHGSGFAASATAERGHPFAHVPGLHLSTVREVMVRQDPFISPLADEAQTPSAVMPAADAVLAPQPRKQNRPLDLVPAVRLRAVVVGRRSFALVDEAGAQRIVTIGDKLGGSLVKAISMQGLDLADGAHFNATGTGDTQDHASH